MELIIKCEECGKNICIEVDDCDPAEMSYIDYSCPLCDYEGTYNLGSVEVNDDNDDDMFDIDYLNSMCDYEDICDLESAEVNDDDDDSYDLE